MEIKAIFDGGEVDLVRGWVSKGRGSDLFWGRRGGEGVYLEEIDGI